MVTINKPTRITWESRTQVFQSTQIIKLLQSAGVPLSSIDDDSVDKSKIVCVAEVHEDKVKGMVVTPSSLVYRFETDEFDPHFWNFACKYYYVITGNSQDRTRMAYLSNVDSSEITGMMMDKKKSENLSKLTIDEILQKMKEKAAPEQSGLF